MRGASIFTRGTVAGSAAGAGGTAAPGEPSSGVGSPVAPETALVCAICRVGGFGRCGATSSWKPSRMASDTAIARKSRFWSINAPFTGRCHPRRHGHRIDTTFMPRVAAQDTLCRHHRSPRRAMHPQRLHGIFAAAWPEAAMRADQRTHRPLIHPNRADPNLRRPAMIEPVMIEPVIRRSGPERA